MEELTIYRVRSDGVYAGSTTLQVNDAFRAGIPRGYTRIAPPEQEGYYAVMRGEWVLVQGEIPPEPEPSAPEPSADDILAALLIAGRLATQGMILQDDLTPGELSAIASLYEPFRPGEAVFGPNDPNGNIQTVRRFGSALYKAVQSHTTQADWEPPSVPALWVEIGAPGVTPAWIQPQGEHDSYALGDQVSHNGFLWESNHDGANSWEPGEFGWTNLGAI